MSTVAVSVAQTASGTVAVSVAQTASGTGVVSGVDPGWREAAP